jgi:transposase InsO family protein
VVDPDAPLPTDLVERRFDTGVLDRVWTSDITNQRTGQCWLYLCAVRDGCSRRVIGWTIDEHIRADLVESALAMAVAMRGELELGRFARRHNLTHSVGRVGVLPRKRWRRIILGNSKSRVLRPIPWAHPHRP